MACGLASLLWAPFLCVVVSLPPSPLPLSPLPLLPSAHLPTSHSHVCMKISRLDGGVVVHSRGRGVEGWCATTKRTHVFSWCGSTGLPINRHLPPSRAAGAFYRVCPGVPARNPSLQVHRYSLNCILCCSQSGACMRRSFTLPPPPSILPRCTHCDALSTQRPIVLNGHDRPITMVKYNHDGDLVFSCSKSKDGSVGLWRSATGERLGTYDGHKGVVWSLDVTRA